MATTMSPSKSSVPFAIGTLLTKSITDKLDRGIRDLEVNYGLKGLLTWSMVRTPSGWAFTLLHEDSTKPIVSVHNKGSVGLNTFLTTCGKYIASHYGASATKQRRTA